MEGLTNEYLDSTHLVGNIPTYLSTDNVSQSLHQDLVSLLVITERTLTWHSGLTLAMDPNLNQIEMVMMAAAACSLFVRGNRFLSELANPNSH